MVMGNYRNIALLGLVLMFNYAHSQTHIGGDISGRLTAEGSPYHVDLDDFNYLSINEEDTLIIEAGVTILFLNIGGIYCDGVIMAEGTAEDSIHFDRLTDRLWDSIIIYNESGDLNRSYHFSYCTFRNTRTQWGGLEDLMGAILAPQNLILEHCTFEQIEYTAITCGGSFTIRDCVFDRPQLAVLSQAGGDYDCLIERSVFVNTVINQARSRTLRVSDCLFISNRETGGGISSDGSLMVNNCLFINRGIGSRESLIVENCIFDGDGPMIYGNQNTTVRYSLFHNHGNDEYLREVELENFGVLDRTNTNNDSTDIYGNLFMDPRLAMEGVFPEMYYPTEDSPCIDAGNPDSDPDPDSTLADIGPFFFPQCNIRVNPIEVEFANAQTGLRFEESIEIRNVGLRLLNIIDISLTPDDTPFRFAYDWGEAEEILPDSSSVVWILFDPQQEGVYEAVLSIESNDRDEGIVEVNISGNALTIDQQPEITPCEFGMETPYPNPFNSNVQLRFTLATESIAHLVIYDLSGREVAILNDGELTIGNHVSTWQADDFPTGLYFAKLISGDNVKTVRMTLIK